MSQLQALGQQLKALHAESFGWALHCCYQQQEEAEDVLQNVYLKILEKRARFQGKSSFKTWLFSVIRNTAIDQQRKKRWKKVSVDVLANLIDESDTTTEEAKQKELAKVLKSSLEQLSAKQKEVMQLVFYHNFTLSEAAVVMQTSIGSARKHYDRAKQKLRNLLKEQTAWKALLLH